MGSYGIFSALIATIGRVGFGSEQGLASRYTTFAAYSLVAVIYLIAIVIDDLKTRGREKFKNIVGYTAAGLVGIFITLHSITAVYAAVQMQTMHRERLIGKACLLFINVAPVSDCIESKLYWKSIAGIDFGGAERVRKIALALNSLGWLHPPLLESNLLKETLDNAGLNYGFFDTFRSTGDRQYLAAGWAYLPKQMRPADAVALTYDTGSGAKVFKIVPVGEERADVKQAMHSDTYLRSGWRSEISAAEVPKNTLRIEAWAFDVSTATAFKLAMVSGYEKMHDPT